MIKGILIITCFSLPNVIFCNDITPEDLKEMQFACSIINGNLKDGPKCIKIQKKLVEARCKKGDPNACKALQETNSNKKK